MNTYEEEEKRQVTQKAFQHVLQNTDHITLAMRAPLAVYDRTHTPTESLEMRLEAVTAAQLESKEPTPLLNLQSDYLATLATSGSEEDKQGYLDNEKSVLENLKSPEVNANEFDYIQPGRGAYGR
ncbi:hypothetical protein [Listeria booriae]|uniref:Uncharacterized protein n=1 Tax=Listeria booriae TaxID=1552123 RepID=A0A842A4C3_9LIST|nr:hypothetical protein [Listeria booriae]MBC1567210.1 hypothetical protein [Listeria booriae]